MIVLVANNNIVNRGACWWTVVLDAPLSAQTFMHWVLHQTLWSFVYPLRVWSAAVICVSASCVSMEQRDDRRVRRHNCNAVLTSVGDISRCAYFTGLTVWRCLCVSQDWSSGAVCKFCEIDRLALFLYFMGLIIWHCLQSCLRSALCERGSDCDWWGSLPAQTPTASTLSPVVAGFLLLLILPMHMPDIY